MQNLFFCMKFCNFMQKNKKEKSMSKQLISIPHVDLVIVIDTSHSIKNEAQALTDAAASARQS